MPRKHFPVLVLVLPALLIVLAGCQQIDEQIWVQPDGSGRLVFRFSAPAELMAEGGGFNTPIRYVFENNLPDFSAASILPMKPSRWIYARRCKTARAR